MKLLAQFFDHAKNRLLYCTHARSATVGDFFVRETLLMLHHEHEPLSRREFFEILQNLLNHDVVEGRSIRPGNRESFPFSNIRGPQRFVLSLVTQELIHRDPAQPRVKRRVAPESI